MTDNFQTYLLASAAFPFAVLFYLEVMLANYLIHREAVVRFSGVPWSFRLVFALLGAGLSILIYQLLPWAALGPELQYAMEFVLVFHPLIWLYTPLFKKIGHGASTEAR